MMAQMIGAIVVTMKNVNRMSSRYCVFIYSGDGQLEAF
jgi:hypothetical protein